MPSRICNNFKKLVYDNKGLGGEKWFCTDFSTQEQFIIKPEEPIQGYNEYFAQSFVKLLGLPNIKIKWCDLGSEKLCGTIYEKGLKKIKKADMLNFNSEQKKQFLSLYVINRILLNYDFIEFYLRPNGEVVTLDFGESLFMDVKLFKACELYLDDTKTFEDALKANLTPDNMSKVLNELSKYKMGRLDKDYDEAVLGVYKNISLLSEESFDSFLSDIREYVGEWEYSFYKRIINALISAINQTNRPLLWNDILNED